MFSVSTIIPVAFHVLFLVTATSENLFILAVYFLDWLKTHHLGPADLIIISIAFVNILLQGSFVFNEICNFLFLDFYVQDWVVNPLVVIMTSLAFTSLWCSTTLCFYYYVKIINLSGTLFYKLKANLPVIVPWLLVFSNVISWIIGLPAYWDIYRESPFSTNATNVPLTNHMTYKSRCNCMFQVYIASSAVAFSIILFTAGTFIKSLHKHMTQIKKNCEGLRHAKLSAHISAARTVTLLLIFHLIFYGMLNVIYSKTEDVGSVIFICSSLVLSSVPSVIGLILIFGNRKLSNKLRYLIGVISTSGNIEVSVAT